MKAFGRICAYAMLMTCGCVSGESPPGDRHDGPALFAAAEEGKADVVQSLLAHGADPNYVSNRLTPLHVASRAGHIEVVEQLLDREARIQAAPDGCTPLHIAAHIGNAGIVRLLLNHGAQVNAKMIVSGCQNKSFRFTDEYAKTRQLTPLMMAARQGHTDVVELLLDAGASVKDRDAMSQKSARDFAAEGGHGSVEGILKLAEAGQWRKRPDEQRGVKSDIAPVNRLDIPIQ